MPTLPKPKARPTTDERVSFTPGARVLNHLQRIEESLETMQTFIRKSMNAVATRKDLTATENKIMGAITTFLNQQKAFNTQSRDAVASIAASVTEVAEDVDELLRKLAELDNNPGEFTPEDQAIVTELITEGSEAAAKLTAAAEALAAVNAKVPPVVPVIPSNQ